MTRNTGTTTISVRFNNSGTVNVDSGRLALNGGGTSTGAFAATATLRFAGIHDLTAGSVTGSGMAVSTAAIVPLRVPYHLR